VCVLSAVRLCGAEVLFVCKWCCSCVRCCMCVRCVCGAVACVHVDVCVCGVLFV